MPPKRTNQPKSTPSAAKKKAEVPTSPDLSSEEEDSVTCTLCHLELGDVVPHACEDFQEEEFRIETSNPKKPRGRKPKMTEEEKQQQKAKKKQAQSARLANHLRAAASKEASKATSTTSTRKNPAKEAEAVDSSSPKRDEKRPAAEPAIKAAAQKHVTGAQFNNSVQKKKFGLGATIKNTPELEELSLNLEKKLKDGAKPSSALQATIALKKKDCDRITKSIMAKKKTSSIPDPTESLFLSDDDDCILLEDSLPPKGSTSSTSSSSSYSSSSSSPSSGSARQRRDPSKQMTFIMDGFDDAVMDLFADFKDEVDTAEEHLFRLLVECNNLNKTIAEINEKAKAKAEAEKSSSKKKASSKNSFYWPAYKRQKLSPSPFGSDDEQSIDDLFDYSPGPSKITLRKAKPEPMD